MVIRDSRSVSQHGVFIAFALYFTGQCPLFCEYLCKTKQFAKKVFSVDQRPLWVRFIKEEKKSRDTAAQQFRPNLEQLEVVSF